MSKEQEELFKKTWPIHYAKWKAKNIKPKGDEK